MRGKGVKDVGVVEDAGGVKALRIVRSPATSPLPSEAGSVQEERRWIHETMKQLICMGVLPRGVE